MKIAPRDIENFIKNPSGDYTAILMFGPDESLVRERAKIIGLTVVKDIQDPFNVVDLAEEVVEDDTARLADELAAMSMMGGRRLIRIRNATNKIADILAEALKHGPSTDNIIVLEAGDLKTTSKLRKICEKQKNAAAVPCYVENARDLGIVIAKVFSAAKLSISNEALQNLAAKQVGDRAMAVQTAEKIITYIGLEKTEVTLDDILACTEDSSILFMNDLISHTMSGHVQDSNLMLRRLFQEDMPPVAICRGLQNYLQRLTLAKAYMDDGDNASMAMKKLRPPVFFKEQQNFINHLQLWPVLTLNKLLQQTTDTEAACKTTGIPDKTICDRLIFRIARMAERLNKRRRTA